MSEPIESAVPPGQMPAGATGMQEGSDGKMYFHDIKGTQMGLAPENIQQDQSADTTPPQKPAFNPDKPIDDAPQQSATPAQPQAQTKPAFNPDKPIDAVGKPKFDPSKPIDGEQDPHQPPVGMKTGDYQIRKGGPVVNIITAGQKPGTITHHNPITPLPGESFNDTMKRAIQAASAVTPEQIKEDQDQSLMEAPGVLATAAALGASGPVVYGGAKGVSVLKQAVIGGDDQILGHPENLMTPEFRKAHPYWSGAGEMVGGLSNPENAAMIIGGGALGKLPGTAAKVAQRIVAGGFGIDMLSSAVRQSPELWDVMQGNGQYADMDLDDRESLAKNMVFKITTGAAMGAHSLEHGVIGENNALTDLGDKADKGFQENLSKAGKFTADKIGAAMGRTNDFDTAVKRASKITPKQYLKHVEKIKNVSEDLQAIASQNADKIEDPKSFGDAINQHIQGQEQKLQDTAGATRDSDEPLTQDLYGKLRTRLDKFFDDNRQKFGSTSEVERAKQDVMDRVMVESEPDANGETEHAPPNLWEAEHTRQGLNTDAAPQYNTNARPTTDAYKRGAAEAANFLREEIDQAYHRKGIANVKEWRAKEADLIDVRDKLYDAQAKADQMGNPSIFKSTFNKIGAPSSVIAIALGHPIGAAGIASAVAAERIHQNYTNPNFNVNRAVDLADQNAKLTQPETYTQYPNPPAGSGPAPPSNSPAGATPPAPPTPTGTANNRPQVKYRPSEKAAILSGPVKDLGKEWNANTEAHEIERNKDIIRNPKATPEDIQIATQRLNESRERALEIARQLQESLNQPQEAPVVTPGGRQFSQLHGELASHYGEVVGQSTYPELEGRLMAEIAAKTQRGNPLDSGEKNLLNKINQAKVKDVQDAQGRSDDQRKSIAETIDQWQEVSEKAAAEAKAAQDAQTQSDQEKVASGLNTNTAPPFDPISHIPLPQAWEDKGINGAVVAAHELGHHIMVDKLGHAVEDMWSHLHPQIGPNAMGMARYTAPKMFTDGKLNMTPENTNHILDILHGGPIAQELVTGTPMEKSIGAQGDLQEMRKHLLDAGFNPVEAAQLMKASEMRVRAALTEPGIADIIKRYTQFRQNGLDSKYLMSPEAIGAALQEIRDAGGSNGTTTDGKSPASGKAGASDSGKDAGGASKVPARNSQEPKPAGKTGAFTRRAGDGSGVKPEPPAEMKIAHGGIESAPPPERTTGNADYDAAIKAGGGIPGGVTDFKEFGKIINFHDPRTGSTLGIKEGKTPITPENVKAQIDAKHQEYGLPPAEMATAAASKTPMSDAILQKNERATDPTESGFIFPGGEHVGLPPGQEHESMIAQATGDNEGVPNYAARDAIIQNEGAVRLRKRTGRGGDELAYSVPSSGVTEAQLQRIRQGVAKQGRYGNVQMETGAGKSLPLKEFAMPSHVDQMLRDLNAHPEQMGAEMSDPDMHKTQDELRAQSMHKNAEDMGAIFDNPRVHGADLNQIAAHEKDGGSTFTPQGENLANKNLYSVGAHPDRTLAVDKLTPEVLNKFKADNADLLKSGDRAVGTWKDPDTGKAVLDITKLHTNRDAAVAEGQALNQKAIYHLGGEGEIPTGGTGEGLAPVQGAAMSDPEIMDERNSDPAKVAEFRGEFKKQFDDAVAKFRASNNPAEQRDLIKQIGRLQNMKGGLEVGDELSSDPKYRTGQDNKFIQDLMREKQTPQLGAEMTDQPKPENSDRVSTRVPTAKAAKDYTPEDHMGPNKLVIDRAAVDADPKLAQKMADKVRDYPGVKVPKNLTDPKKILDSFTKHIKDNLLHLWDSVPAEARENNRKWYDSVNGKANRDAAEYGMEPRQAAGTYAVLSPQKDWDMNADLARRVQDVHFNHPDDPGTPEMEQFGQNYIAKGRADLEKMQGKLEAKGIEPEKIAKRVAQRTKNLDTLEQVMNDIAGKKYSELNDYQAGVHTRLWDETHNPRNYPKIDPATGNPMGDVMTDKGVPGDIAWGSFGPIGNAVSILRDGSLENISNRLGGEHKVRNFYNNIIEPSHPKDVTIDTHAVAAGFMQPMSGQSREVRDNLGAGGSSARTGVSGIYPLIADAYRQAAAERGVLPRELQSVTWEKIRDMFPAEIKDAAFQKEARDIWQKYSDGKISANDARQQVTQSAETRRATQTAKNEAKANVPGRISALDFLAALRHNGGMHSLGGKP